MDDLQRRAARQLPRVDKEGLFVRRKVQKWQFAGPDPDVVLSDVRSLEGKPEEGNGECVTLVKNHTSVGWTGNWRQGNEVVGRNTLEQGTAIATFVNGRYANNSHDNHAAFYMGQVSDGIYIMDQWRSKAKIGKRFIRRKGKDAQGHFIDPSNNADAFFVIE